ncbi:MAG: DUF3618 domain-containing protein [Solirubrobacterales bacterium]|nr:DUF3618 domain-containing protein [Solirubrobacterales bacterium]
MGQDPSQPGQELGGDAERSPEQLRAEIEQTREEMGDTVAALAEKTDVKAQAQRAAQNARATATAKVNEIKGSVPFRKDDAGASGSPEAAVGSAGDAGKQLAGLAQRNRVGLMVGGALLVGILIGRSRS